MTLTTENDQRQRHIESAAGQRIRRAAAIMSDPTAPVWCEAGRYAHSHHEPFYHPAFERLMAGIPIETSQTFSHQQLVALSIASIPRNAPHAIDYRVSIPFFGKRFYLTVLGGRERRSYARLARESQLLTQQLANLDSTVLAILMSFAIIGFVIMLYIVKSALGIDLFEGELAMHDMFLQLNMQPAL